MSCAGLEPVLRVAQRCDLHGIVAERLHFPTDKGCNASGKVATIVAGMLTGADSIDDLDVVRHGGMASLFGGVYAPSTLGEFLRAFSHGHVRQLQGASREFLVQLARHIPLLPGAGAVTFIFAVRQISRLRQLVAWAAHRVGLDRERGHDLALAVTEAASNVIRHGGGHGRLDLLRDDDRALIAEISDDGPGMATVLPAVLPSAQRSSGRGLYLIEQSCDHVEYRTRPAGTTVHLEVNLHHQQDQP